MASVNKVIIIGNCGRDPELRYMPNGDAVCNLSIATTRSWKDKNSGEKQEETEWHRVTFYQRLAEIAGQYLKKGSAAYVEGRLKTRKWQDKDGKDQYTTEIIAESLQLFGQREGGAARSGPPPEGQAQRPASGATSAQRPAGASAPAPAAGGGLEEDDIPF